MPDTSLLFGPLLIGTFFNTILYGVCLVQTFIYYRTYTSDKQWLRYFVLYLFILETANTAFDMVMMYEPLVLHFGQPRSLIEAPMMLIADPLVLGLISTSAQFFIAWRIRVITQSLILPVIIGGFAIVAFGGSITLSVSVARFPLFVKFQDFRPSIVTWLGASAIADLLITVILYWSLTKRKTGIKTTDDRISTIIRLTVHTGLLTAILALADLLVATCIPHTTLNFIWDLPLSKIYTNSILSTLNARAAWHGLEVIPSDMNDNVLFGRLNFDMTEFHARTRNDIAIESIVRADLGTELRPHVKLRRLPTLSEAENGLAVLTTTNTVIERSERSSGDGSEFNEKVIDVR